MGSEQQPEIRHEYLMTVRTHAPTTVTQTLTSTENQFKILHLTLNSITAVGHLLLDYVDYNTCREQYSMTSFPTKIAGDLAGAIFTIANIQKTHFNNK